ncbi:cytochrome c oxidase assembly protein COX16 homolog, mitochondrial isoform X1 [Pleurodeles waltl]
MLPGVRRAFQKNKTLRYGLPMFLLIIGGSFGLREFTQIRYDAQKLRGKLDPALEEKVRKKSVSIESEYDKLRDSSFNDWQNIRGPRPWEETQPLQEQERKAVASKQS